jgi:serine/threonine protein kinase
MTSIQSGTRLGPYEVVALVGAGGMGEVYKARDTRLDRTVAIKVLSPQLSADPEFKQRFEREARAIGALSHAHICTLYDVGGDHDVEYLVVEFLEGETLADCLRRGPLAIEQALAYSVQIADALAKAHRAGVVHRDLKPANVMVTKAGVKLLDFGLAKVVNSLQPSASAEAVTAAVSLTTQRVVLGTVQYMAPEQLDGGQVDARTDIFAFGIVLYEMLTGTRPFSGNTTAHVIAEIIERVPEPVTARRQAVPAAVARTVEKCLRKDPDERWQTADDLRDELAWARHPTLPAGGSETPARWKAVLPWVIAAALLLSTAALAGMLWRRAPVAEARTYVVPVLSTPEVAEDPLHGFALSPDGRQLALVTQGSDGAPILSVRTLENVSRILPGTSGASTPFWSANGRSIGFFSADRLMRVDLADGAVREICRSGRSRQRFSGAWNADDVIVFGLGAASGLSRVNADGGEPTILTRLEPETGEGAHSQPVFLPDQHHFLFVAEGSNSARLFVGDIEGHPSKLLMKDVVAASFARGHVLFVRGGNLLAQQLDLSRFEMIGKTALIVANVLVSSKQADGAAFSVSSLGGNWCTGPEARVCRSSPCSIERQTGFE